MLWSQQLADGDASEPSTNLVSAISDSACNSTKGCFSTDNRWHKEMFTSCAAFETRWASTWGCHRNAASIRILFSQRSVFGKENVSYSRNAAKNSAKGNFKIVTKTSDFLPCSSIPTAHHLPRRNFSRLDHKTVQVQYSWDTQPQRSLSCRHSVVYGTTVHSDSCLWSSRYELALEICWKRRRLTSAATSAHVFDEDTASCLHAAEFATVQLRARVSSPKVHSLESKRNLLFRCRERSERWPGAHVYATPLRKGPRAADSTLSRSRLPAKHRRFGTRRDAARENVAENPCTGVGQAWAVSAFCPENGASGELTLEIIGRSVSWAVISLSQRSSYHYDCYRK